MGGKVCYPPTTYRDRYMKDIREGKLTQPAEDIWLFTDQMTPLPWHVELSIPDTCKGLDVAVWIQARLLDRKTKALLAQESKRIQFQLETRKGMDIGS